jgi:hypothetical protein
MSFSKKIQTAVDDVINKYIDQVSSKYNINKSELLKIWSGEESKIVDSSSTKTTNSSLNSLTKPELIELCKIKGLKCSGTKAQLIEVLTKCENNSEKTTSKTSTSSVVEKKVLKIESPGKQEPVIKKLVAKIPNISIKRNKFDNYEHEETSFVFNNKEKKVYGKQNPDGSVSPLTKEDIDLCNKYKFAYYIPENLDKKTNLNDVELEELEDDEVEEEDDFEEEDDVEEEDVEEEEEEFEEEYYED